MVPLERALEAALRRDEVAAELERQARQEELADAFLRRRRRCRRRRRRRPQRRSPSSRSRRISIFDSLAGLTATGEISDGGDDDVAGESSSTAGTAAAAAAEHKEGESTSYFHTHTSPLLLPTMAWGFRVLAEACRRSRGMRRLAAARTARAEAERRVVLGETFAGWAVETALVRGGREARRRRTVETARLCLARWKVFAAFEAK